MLHYTFTDRFQTLYQHAVAAYRGGKRGADTFFNAKEKAWLASNGLTAQNLYDYAEDEVGYGEPSFEQALGIELVRRDYFLNEQNGVPSTRMLDEASLPPKSAAARGIEWLPRLIPKTRAKLRGELPPSLMYCCGGDRNFFRTHDILPCEFLSLIWRAGMSDTKVIDWVVQRSAASQMK